MASGKNKEANKTSGGIRAQIMSGYLKIILLIILLTIVTVVCLIFIQRNSTVVIDDQNNRSSIQTAIVGHYSWLDQLSISIQTGSEFAGSLDHTACSFGKWLSAVSGEQIDDRQITNALGAAVGPHETIHTMAKDILTLSKTDKDAAYQKYIDEIKPQTSEVIAQLQIVDSRYEAAVAEASAQLTFLISFAIFFTLLLTVVATAFAVFLARRISIKISRPIVTVSRWAKKLALGIEDLGYEAELLDKNQDNEVGIMIRAFETMANSIQENVNVVRRVAEGDMTAFVNIRSSQDSLGKNLYRMVQSNNSLFNEIVEIAHAVATGSSEIAKASESLARTSTEQASSVQDLSSTVEEASSLISQNSENTHVARDITQKIKTDANASNEKMDLLAQSVESIRVASERISGIIKSIDSIAFETNILALNAAIEASRAGDAGRGFAVVADEVRNLALKSAEAANESKAMIEDAIKKTQVGNNIALEASAMYATIVEGIEQIVEITHAVAMSSEEQLQGIERVNKGIQEISKAAEHNAAISEESAAASSAMNNNAALLRESMNSFNLRIRQQNRAYIPPEKANDPEFIRHANEAFEKAKVTKRYDNEYIDPRVSEMLKE